MRRANNTGTIFKLKGNRHNPYVAYVYGEKVINEQKGTTYRKRTAIGYYASRKDAQDALQAYIMQPFDLVNRDLTLQEVWQIVFDKLKVSDSRRDRYKSAFKYLAPIKVMPLKDIKAIHLQEVIDDCPKSSAVKADIKSIINKCFAYGLENDIIQKDYSKFVTFQRDKVQKERVVFTGEEVQKIWERQNEWQYKFLLILLYTGARPNEIIDLLKENINLDEGYFKIIASKTDAGVRTVPIHDAIRPIFDELMLTGSNYLITSQKGLKIQYKNFASRDIKEIRDYLENEHSLYDCRHTFVSRARECGVDLLTIQRIVGHKQNTVTEAVYTHVQLQELKDKINMVNYTV